MHPKLKGLLWATAACLLAAVMAFGVRPLAHAVPWRYELKVAEALDDAPFTPGCRNAGARALLQKLVTRLYPVRPDDHDFSITVRVEDDPEVNAYAALGGRITVYSELITQAGSAEELAGVLAHEMEHVRHRHILEGALLHLMTSASLQMIGWDSPNELQWSRYFLNMSFTRDQEEQADEGGLERLQAAHVSNRGFRDFFARMAREEHATSFLSDHPAGEDRQAMVERFANVNTLPVMTREEWAELKSGCGRK